MFIVRASLVRMIRISTLFFNDDVWCTILYVILCQQLGLKNVASEISYLRFELFFSIDTAVSLHKSY